MPLIEEVNYTLLEFLSGNYFGEYLIGGGFTYEGLSTVDNPSVLIITNFDNENFIISGTFEFY
jgi:hypothetical protein